MSTDKIIPSQFHEHLSLVITQMEEEYVLLYKQITEQLTLIKNVKQISKEIKFL